MEFSFIFIEFIQEETFSPMKLVPHVVMVTTIKIINPVNKAPNRHPSLTIFIILPVSSLTIFSKDTKVLTTSCEMEQREGSPIHIPIIASRNSNLFLCASLASAGETSTEGVECLVPLENTENEKTPISIAPKKIIDPQQIRISSMFYHPVFATMT